MRKQPIATLAVVILTAALLEAQTKVPPPAPGTPRNLVIPAIQRFELANGLRVRLVPYGNVPKATVRLVTTTGYVDEQANEIWLAYFTGTLMWRGTASRSTEQIEQEEALMGGAIRIAVEENQTSIGGDVFSESAPSAVALIADIVRQPLLPESELADSKDNPLLDLIVDQSRWLLSAAEKFHSVLFPNSPYGSYIPTPEMLRGFTIEQVRSFHERNFGAARSTLYVVGRFDAASVEKAVRASFAEWKRGNPPSRPQVSPVSRRGVYLIERRRATQSTLFIGLPVINATHPDYLALTVTDALLGGSFMSRITSNIREQKGYTRSPRSTLSTLVGAALWAEIADVTTNVTGAAIKEILGEIDRLRAEPPSETELRDIQNYVAGTFVLENSSRAGIANQLAFLDLYGLSEDYLRTYVQQVYALTPADIQRLATTHLDPSKMTIVVVGNPAQVRGQIEPFGEVHP